MTLVELVIVIATLSIIGFVMIPKFNVYNEIQLKTAVKQLGADVRFAQSRAISTRIRHGVTFDPVANRYTVYHGDPSTPENDVLDPGKVLRREWDRVDIVSAVFDAGSTVEFNSLGVPFDGTGIELSSDGVVVLGEGAVVDTVWVRALTGKVTF